MRKFQRVVFVFAVLGAIACSKAARICPEGMDLVADRSASGKISWCRSKDAVTARWIEYYDGGKERRQSCAFSTGRPEGTYSAWHPGGKTWIEGQYREGVKVGKWVQWDKDGQKVAEGEYRKGQFIAGAPVGIPAKCETMKP